MIDLPEKFIERMKTRLGGEFSRFMESYALPAERGIRVNTLKISVADFLEISPFNLEQTDWCKEAFYADSESLGKSIFHAQGLYYVQEPSASSVAPKLNVKPFERVLDLCSAPGGKGTQLAAYMQGNGIIYMNEIVFKRAKILSQNVERLGVKNAVVISASPVALSERFGGYFDKILIDAPCSGEGMFKKEENAISNWSLDNIRLCTERGEGILTEARKMLANGGRIVFSTCTFAQEEDEEQIEKFLKNNQDFELLESQTLFPHKVRGEGHFYAVLQHKGERADRQVLPVKTTKIDKKLLNEWHKFQAETLKVSFDNLFLSGDTLYSLPDDCIIPDLQILRAGVRLGEFVGGRFEPSHSLAMCLKSGECKSVEIDERTAIDYLKGRTFEVADGSGWTVAMHLGKPLGWVKIVQSTAKNHYPKGLRI